MHRLLARQLRKAGLSAEHPPADPAGWSLLLAGVERSYDQMDEGRYLMEQSMEALSREMRELYESLEASRAEQAALRRVATAVAERRDLERLFDLVAREAAASMGCESARVMRDDVSGASVVAGSWVADDLPGMAPEFSLSTPIRVDGAPWGALTVTSGRAGRPAGAGARLGDFAELVAVAISNAADRSRLAALAATDSLTGLANHRAFQERLIAETGRARRHGTALSLVLLDLDGFKAVNDSLGHQAGDEVLVALAERMRARVREGEMLARVGGEEFAWLLPESDAHGALEAAERLRADIAARPLGPVPQQTVSVGLCDIAAAAGDPAELFRLADGALYWAKRCGRDRAVRYTPEVVRELSPSEHAARAVEAGALSAVRALARAVDARDPGARGHATRVAEVAVMLAVELGWETDRASLLRDAALLHDVGEIGVADDLLRAARPLTPAQYEHVKEHAALGGRILLGVLGGEQVSWVRHHHERWDGRGYPGGLRAHEIPEGARLIGLAEAWDAMTGGRAHREPLEVGEALAECRACAGSHFDPAAVLALRALAGAGRLTAPPAALPGDSGDEPLGQPDARVRVAGRDALVLGEGVHGPSVRLALEEVAPPAA